MSSLRRTAPCAIDSAPRAWRPAALLLAAIVAAAPAQAQPAQAPQAPVAPQAPASAAAPAAPSAPTQVAPASPQQVSPAAPQQTSPASATQGVAPAAPFVVTPSFDCSKRVNAAQRIVCADTALSVLDAKLGQVFTDVWRRQPQDKNLAYFAAEQRDWTASRDGCPQTSNPTACLSSVYRTRIAELQGRYRLVPVRGPFRFACEGEPPRTVVVTWFETDPPSGRVETSDGATTVYSAPSASGARYIGDDMQVWEHQGELSVAYASRKLELNCHPKQG